MKYDAAGKLTLSDSTGDLVVLGDPVVPRQGHGCERVGPQPPLYSEGAPGLKVSIRPDTGSERNAQAAFDLHFGPKVTTITDGAWIEDGQLKVDLDKPGVDWSAVQAAIEARRR